jgi:hypothetical protein
MQPKPFQFRSEVVRVARTWINTPFSRQGHVKGLRCDCISLIVETLRETGYKPAIDFVYPANYPHLPRDTDDTIRRLCDDHFEKITPKQVRPADIALVGWGRKIPVHLAFFADYLDKHERLSLIQSLIIPGSVQEHIYAGDWVERTVSVYRVPGII